MAKFSTYAVETTPTGSMTVLIYDSAEAAAANKIKQLSLTNLFQGALDGDPAVCDFRLTLETGVPVSTTNQSAKTTLYAALYKGNSIGLYNGSAWNIRTPCGVTLSFVHQKIQTL